MRFGFWEEIVSKILGARCLRLSVWGGLKKKLWGTALAIWDLGRVSFERKLRDTVLAIWDLGRVSFQSKLRDTVLAIWYLGRDSFQNSRGTVLAIECLGRIFKKKTMGHGACDSGFGKG